MYHPPSKRKQLVQRAVIYTLMSVTVVTLVTALVFFMLGYRFNKNDGKLEQGGLVQLIATPNGADVRIDGSDFNDQTPTKATLAAGSHHFTMNRQGYRQWQKTIDLEAGSVLWLNYARLVPNTLTPENVANFPSLGSTAASPDDKWMAAIANEKTPVITLADLSRDKIEPKTITVPPIYTKPSKGKTQRFTLETWDPTSRFLLVKNEYDGKKVEWLVVDAGSVEKSKNVTTLLDIDASKIKFSYSDSNALYAQIEGDVRKINLADATMSRPLVQDVAEFDLYDRSTITYVTKPNQKTGQRTVGYYTDGATKPRTLKTFSEKQKDSLHLTIGRYFHDDYVSILYGDTLEITFGDLPRSDSNNASSLKAVATVTIPGGADYLSSKTSGRFVVAQHGTTYTVYDLELKKMTTTNLKGDGKLSKEIDWIDGYMPWSDLGGTLRLYEFDGANQNDIMPVAPGYSVTLSPSDKYLYGFTKSKDGYHLTRVRMVL